MCTFEYRWRRATKRNRAKLRNRKIHSLTHPSKCIIIIIYAVYVSAERDLILTQDTFWNQFSFASSSTLLIENVSHLPVNEGLLLSSRVNCKYNQGESKGRSSWIRLYDAIKQEPRWLMTYCYYCTRHLSILHWELFSCLVLLLSHDGIFYQIYLTEKKKKIETQREKHWKQQKA